MLVNAQKTQLILADHDIPANSIRRSSAQPITGLTIQSDDSTNPHVADLFLDGGMDGENTQSDECIEESGACDHSDHTYSALCESILESPDKLPDDFEHSIVAQEFGYVKIRCNCKDAADCVRWVKSFGDKTRSTWRVLHNYPKRSSFRKDYCCHLGRRNKVLVELDPTKRNPRSKFNDCGARLAIQVQCMHEHA